MFAGKSLGPVVSYLVNILGVGLPTCCTFNAFEVGLNTKISGSCQYATVLYTVPATLIAPMRRIPVVHYRKCTKSGEDL